VVRQCWHRLGDGKVHTCIFFETISHQRSLRVPDGNHHRQYRQEGIDLKIREQIKTGTFPIRLKPKDWNSGPVNWLLDVIAPDRKATGQVIANFRQVVKEGDLRIHPIVAGLVDEDMRGKMTGDTKNG